MQAGDETAEQRRTQRVALAVLMGLAFLVVAWMAAPLLVGLALGTVVGFASQPLHSALSSRMGQRRTLASALTTAIVGMIMVGGGGVLLWIFAREFVEAATLLQLELFHGSGPTVLGPRTTRLLSTLGIPQELVVGRLREELGRMANLIAQGVGLLVAASAGIVLTIVIALWTTFYVLRDWPRIARHLERLLPLERRHTRALVAEFRNVGRQAFLGTLTSAAVQGTLAGIGFALVGVPQAVTWGALLALLSFIPVVGTLFVWVPAAVWLLTAGHVARALLLAGWSLVVVMATTDYVIRPRLVGRGEGHPLLMLVGLIGGISVFGIAGVIVGPVIMSLFVATARIYEREQGGD